MGEFTTLMARDGHEFQAYLAAPKGAPRGAVVVVQEIFGVNHHIRAVTDGYAAQGYTAIAPALFDRVRRGIELGYTAEEVQQGIGYMLQVKPAQFLADVGAAVNAVRGSGRVGIVGYCWGGTVAWLAACELPVAAAASYYGGGIVKLLAQTPKCPVIYHYGEKDSHIPLADVDKIRAAHPAGVFHIYPADHGFNCTERAAYDAPSAALAFERTLAFFAGHVG
ncbi:MAG: carboxymethylenebutenolidase [Steroidobacteraceae bacterium]